MIVVYLLFYLVIILFLGIAYITRIIGFKDLVIYRRIDNSRILEGESCKISTIIENKKVFPIPFLMVKEKMTQGLEYDGEILKNDDVGVVCHTSKYRVSGNSRKVRTYRVRAKRGAYLLKDLTVGLSDIFALNVESREFKELIEVVVYPKTTSIKNMIFDATNFNGENTVRRWIQKDDLYIKGIREYRVEDRMKDIHWKSSLKMDRLMVKDYDFTSDDEIMIIFNVQCHKNHWQNINEDCIENGIKVAVALAGQAQKEGIATGMCTNSRIMSNNENFPDMIMPTNNNYQRILEICARIDYGMSHTFKDYLNMKKDKLNKNCTYIIIASYLDKESLEFLKKAKEYGTKLKIIDVSKNGSVDRVKGIEKVWFEGMKI